MNERDGRKVLQRDGKGGMERGICAKLRRCVLLSSKCVFVGRHAFTSSRTRTLKGRVASFAFCSFNVCRQIRENSVKQNRAARRETIDTWPRLVVISGCIVGECFSSHRSTTIAGSTRCTDQKSPWTMYPVMIHLGISVFETSERNVSEILARGMQK